MPAPSTTSERSDDLADLLRGALATEVWTVTTAGTWAQARQRGVELPEQGWKIHVSAIPSNATDVVSRCVETLSGARCAFKVARSTAAVRELTGPHVDRVQAGKVVTVYPADDDAFRRLAADLVDATSGLAGPRILTDRTVSPGGIVHYRYGAFGGVPRFAPNGMLTAVLRAPDGSLVADRREARFSPPAWAVDPLGTVQHTPSGSGLLADRYRVTGAIRHAARGGVFRATDTVGGRPVVVKQGRRHIGEASVGEDSRVRLRREADILRELHDVPGLPRLVEVFEQEGDVFLVEDDLGGCSLSGWVTSEADRDPRRVLAILADLAGLVGSFHERGLVLRDLSPNNVIVGADGTVGLVDLETVLRAGENPELGRGATAPYAAPEHLADPSAAGDVFSLGAVAVFAFTGEHPMREEWLPSIRAWLGVAGRRWRLPRDLVALVEAMCAEDPHARPGVAAVEAALRRCLAGPLRMPPAGRAVDAAMVPTHRPLADTELDAAIDALTGAVLAAVHLDGARSAVASSSVGLTTAPTNVHHGSAGVVLALARHHALVADGRVVPTLTGLVDWTRRRAGELPEGVPVGMSFGAGGTAYALSVAGDALGDAGLAEWATEAALALPWDLPVLDVTHGRAGLGLALLQLWDRTHDGRVAVRIAELADSLVAEAVRDGRGVGWPNGEGGTRVVGFGHGLAGVATFLREATDRFGDPSWGATAKESVATLVREAVVVDGCARWRLDLSDRPTTASWWCHGTGGVLVPLLGAPCGTVPAELLRAGGRALVADRWQVGLSYCHGLAGSAEALLDLDAVLPGEGWGSRAAELLALAWARRSTAADGRLSLGDRGVGSVVDFGVGHAGLLAVLLRLRHGGRRSLMPEGVGR